MEPYQVLGKLLLPDDGRYKGSFMSDRRNPLYDIINPTMSYMPWNAPSWDYRTPGYCAYMASAEEEDVCDWHKDNGDSPKCGIVLWASEYPTDIKIGNKRIYGASNSVVLIDNYRVRHRIPKDFVQAVRTGKKTNRHFIRMAMRNEYPTDEQIAQWQHGLAMIADTHVV